MNRIAVIVALLGLAMTGCAPTGESGKGNATDTTRPEREVSAPAAGEAATAPTAAADSPPVTVTGPDDGGGYGAVDVAARDWRTCWDSTAPSEYQLTVTPEWQGMTPAWLSLVVDGQIVEAYGHDDRRYDMDAIFALIDRYVSEQPDSLTVTFDPDLCYPTVIGVDHDAESIDDEGASYILAQPGGRPEGRQVIAPIGSIDVHDDQGGGRATVTFEDGTVFEVGSVTETWTICTQQGFPRCGGLVILNESDTALYAIPLHSDEAGTHWRVPTVGVLDPDAANLTLWEGPILEAGGILDTEGCLSGAVEVGEALAFGTEILLDPATRQAVGVTCY